MSFYLNWKLKRKKRALLHEVQNDIRFILDVKEKYLTPDFQENLRASLQEEHAKDEPDRARIRELEEEVANYNAIQKQLEDLRRMEQELPQYIALIR
jgi:hypothetical protein